MKILRLSASVTIYHKKSSTEYIDFELIRFLFIFQDKTLSFIKSEEKLDHILDKVHKHGGVLCELNSFKNELHITLFQKELLNSWEQNFSIHTQVSSISFKYLLLQIQCITIHMHSSL